ncbi:hypothetical protein Avbf_14040 [Armadillidium vulgare]|nr:hypothetical protein Avbf_14040 [Armadillidium vulgare]
MNTTINLCLLKIYTKRQKRIMKDYEERKEREKAMASNEPDEDGWVTVNRKKRPAPTKESNNKNGPKRKRRKKLKLENFYAFQQKETNMKRKTNIFKY